ncbi:tRNA (N6-threonylcarbamoyladenosine(37)-N6)-methyltransferase TrmO [Acaryochloris sp. IP29b_bin.137]|uniref:tRNA (N6-threonylcarbamoyladenosine(37)-N6)-methyltransferase TrmO n=1 Tax=Acaryochloris sp. IP29b_bin.137 TaxID=2969217 RepID=UPI00261559F1|nr:tRNA (N6-threonylcarbamoyladenosine(37)-N6)-methyltransferase TrmO [Acaryochloris sp. IP29b_bin.137]
MQIEYYPIGVVHSPFITVEGTPIQLSRARQAKGTVEVWDEYIEGLSDLEGFSHLVLLCHLHASRDYNLKVLPFLDTELRGVFATRAPMRPNPIGLSIVKLCGIKAHTLHIEDIDFLEGTPVLDIKPYVGEFDNRAGARFGWLEGARKQTEVADARFKAV